MIDVIVCAIPVGMIMFVWINLAKAVIGLCNDIKKESSMDELQRIFDHIKRGGSIKVRSRELMKGDYPRYCRRCIERRDHCCIGFVFNESDLTEYSINRDWPDKKGRKGSVWFSFTPRRGVESHRCGFFPEQLELI